MLSLHVLLQSDALAPCFTLLFSAASSLGTTVGFVVAGSVAHAVTHSNGALAPVSATSAPRNDDLARGFTPK